MISLRSFATLTAACVVVLSLSGCADNATNPLGSSGLQPTSASFNSSKSITGTIDSRVLLNKSGDGILEVHTGTFVDGTNVATPSGTLSSLTYVVKNGTKTVSTHTVKFSKTVSSYAVHLNLCQSANDDDDDDDGNSWSSSCSSHWLPAYTLTVSANLAGLGSTGTSSGTASGVATVMYLPDVDLTQQVLSVVGAGGTLSAASNVPPAVPTTFSVPIPNDKAIVNGPLGTGTVPNAVGVQATCLVTVDGLPQLPFPSGVYNKYTNPNAFGYVSPVPQTINAGASSPCQFTLSLPLGAHKIVVTAIVLYPGDYDVTNNSTTTFTVNAVSGPPDIAVGVLQQQPTAGGAVVPLGSVNVIAGTSLNLVQWVTLKSGAPTGPIACTLTVKNTTTGEAAVSYTGSAPSSSASCVVAVSFPTVGVYSIVSSVSAPAGVTDPDLSNNTVTNTLTVTSGPPSATVTVGDISYADPYHSGATNLLTSAGAPEDTVHAGDLVTYTADLNVASLINTSAVNVTCKVMEGTTELTATSVPKLTWVTGPALNAVSAGQKSCVFQVAFDETDNAKHLHTLTVSVTTPGSANNAATASATLNGTITDVVRVHITTTPLLRVGNGQVTTGTFALDTTKQSTAVNFQTTISNATSHATKVDCTLTANSLLQAQGAVGTVTGVVVPANGSAACQFHVTASQVGSYPLSITATPTSDAPADPNLTANVATGVLNVVSTGAFSQVNLQSVGLDQAWFNAATSAAFPPELFTVQHVDVNQLALLVVPAQQNLGDFTLTGQVINGTTSFPIGTVSGTVTQASGTSQNCALAAPPGTTYANAPSDFPTAITYAASICSQATQVNGVDGFQAIVINFTQSMTGSITNPDPKWVFGDANGGTVQVKIDLAFTLTPGHAPDHVTATISIPFTIPGTNGSVNHSGQAKWTETSLAPTLVHSGP